MKNEVGSKSTGVKNTKKNCVPFPIPEVNRAADPSKTEYQAATGIEVNCPDVTRHYLKNFPVYNHLVPSLGSLPSKLSILL